MAFLQNGLLVAAACAVFACTSGPRPSFERVFKVDVQGDNAAALEIAPDGGRFWLGLRTGALVSYAEPWQREAKIGLRGTLTGAGRLNDDRVFAADREHVEIWDAALSTKQREFPIPAREPELSRRRLALSMNERYLAVDDAIFDEQLGRWAFAPVGHGHQTALQFGGETLLLTAGFHDQQLVVRELDTGKQHLWQAPAPIKAAVVMQGARRILATTTDTVVSWDPAMLAPSQQIDIAGANELRACSRELGAVLGGRAVYVLELSTLRLRSRFELDADATALGCDGALLAVGDSAGRVHAWDIVHGRLVGVERVLPAPVYAIAVVALARCVVAIANDERGVHAVALRARP